LFWGFMRLALALAVILCCARPWSAFCCKLLQVAEPAPRLFPLNLLLELRALQLEPHAQPEPHAQLVFLVCTHVVFLVLPGLELGGAPGDEPGGASGDERLALVIVKLKLRGGGGLLAVPLHAAPASSRFPLQKTSRSHKGRTIYHSG